MRIIEFAGGVAIDLDRVITVSKATKFEGEGVYYIKLINGKDVSVSDASASDIYNNAMLREDFMNLWKNNNDWRNDFQ